MMLKRKGFIYARQSSGKEEDSESIQMQIERCRELAAKQQIEVLDTFTDANASGRLYPTGAEKLAELDNAFAKWFRNVATDKQYRPGLGRLLARIAGVDCILVYDTTRLYRPLANSFMQQYVDELLVANRVSLVTVKDGESNPSDFSDNLVTTIRSHVNDNQIRLTSEKSQLALMRLKDDGFHPTAPRMYGIRYLGGKERRVEVIDNEAEVIRFVFSQVLARKSYNAILRSLNDRFPDRAYGNGFYITNFRHIVSQPFYCGYMFASHGALIPARQMQGQEIIDLETWQAAQDIVNNPRRPAQHRKEISHPFTGVLRCGYCGSRLLVGMDKGKEYYHCASGEGMGKLECRSARVTLNLNRQKENFTGLKETIRPLLFLGIYRKLQGNCLARQRKDELASLHKGLRERVVAQEELQHAYAEGLVSLDNFIKTTSLLNTVIQRKNAEILIIEQACREGEHREHLLREKLARHSEILAGQMDDIEYEDLLLASIETIECFRDYLQIHTCFGEFQLPRLIQGRFRHFPKFDCSFYNERDTGLGVPSLKIIYHFQKTGVQSVQRIAIFPHIQIFAQK